MNFFCAALSFRLMRFPLWFPFIPEAVEKNVHRVGSRCAKNEWRRAGEAKMGASCLRCDLRCKPKHHELGLRAKGRVIVVR